MTKVLILIVFLIVLLAIFGQDDVETATLNGQDLAEAKARAIACAHRPILCKD